MTKELKISRLIVLFSTVISLIIITGSIVANADNTPPEFNPGDTCTSDDEGDTTTDKSLICDGDEWIFCTSGVTEIIDGKECSGGKWIEESGSTDCDKFVYSSWSSCTGGTKTRSVEEKFPLGCTTNPPASELTQTCTVTVPCTGWGTPGSWTSCVDGKRYRTVSAIPAGCTGTPTSPKPAIEETCTVDAETCDEGDKQNSDVDLCISEDWETCNSSKKGDIELDFSEICDTKWWTCNNTNEALLKNDDKAMCLEGSWIECSSIFENSVVGTKQCKSGKWQDPTTPPSNTCTNGALQNNDSELCVQHNWFKCVSALENSEVSGKQCKDGKWQDPEDDDDDDDDDDDEDGLEISKINVDPKTFNPMLSNVTIKYKVSEDALVELKIEDESNALILKLVDDEEIDGNEEQTEKWNGTNKLDSSGTAVEAGKYFYKLLAKDPTSKDIKDTKTGEITVVYSDMPLPPPGGGDNGGTGNEGQDSFSAHNNPPKKTSGTGPEALIYMVFPVATYLYHRNRRKRQ